MTLVACGRYDFKPLPAKTDGRSATPSDVAIDGAGAPPVDAPSYCEANSATPAQCATAFADPASASDQTLYDCALSCQLELCVVRDTSTCTTCACRAYADSWKICDNTGTCTAPLSGTGCLGDGYYNVPPMNCTSANGLVFEGACIMRYLILAGDCTP